MEEEPGAPRKFRSIRMVPPGDLIYFFSIEDEHLTAFDHKRRQIQTVKDLIKTSADETKGPAVVGEPTSLAEGQTAKMENLAQITSLKQANILKGIPST